MRSLETRYPPMTSLFAYKPMILILCGAPRDSWTVTDTQGPQGWAGLDSVTQRVARLTGGPGLAFTASPGSVSSGEKLKSELAGFESATRSWATSEGFMQKAGLGCLGGLFVIGGGILALLIAGGNFFDMGIVALIPGMLAAGAAPVLASGANTRRTAKGRDLWSKVGGFYRVLSTSSSQNRFDFSMTVGASPAGPTAATLGTDFEVPTSPAPNGSPVTYQVAPGTTGSSSMTRSGFAWRRAPSLALPSAII